MTARWSLADLPDLTGRRALVTGVTSGLGRHTAVELARRGAEVLLAARNETRLCRLVEQVRKAVPGAQVRTLRLDLAELKSVRRAAAEASSYGPLDILVNNAGVMAAPHRSTADGFELHYGTNHLGHFALTGLLLPQLAASGEARVVTVSSQFHRVVRSVPLGDRTMHSGHYQRWIAYARSKLANLLFAFELQRRCSAHAVPVTSVGAHPGFASTNLMTAGLSMDRNGLDRTLVDAATALFAQPVEMGALPILMAAADRTVPGGTYVGPAGPGGMRGLPHQARASRAAYDARLAAGLWRLSEEATGVRFP
ncbi:MAG TPA: oxidoreductase [Nocardioidaceae bacterium]|nr:oxidoreductase [Nocardioidaceae bacterium]